MKKFVFGITGPTGAGKTTVSNIFREKGIYVIDCDTIAKEVTDNNRDCLKELRQTFGDAVFNIDGTLNRPHLANIVFSNDDKLKLLNKITHKYIKDKIRKEIDRACSDIIAIDGAVIIGSPVMDLVHTLVVVTADPEIRIRRIIERDNISFESAQKRILSQMSNAEYESYADFIIKNNDNVRLEENIEEVYSNIKNFRKAKGTKNS